MITAAALRSRRSAGISWPAATVAWADCGKAPGINSSTAAASPSTYAVGYAEASTIGSPATFMGQSIDNTTVVARLAYLGDANLDGKVNAQDFDLLAANYGKSGGTAWTQGDFNYDGVTNVIDFNMLASNFNATPLNAPALGTLVPEPAMIGALAFIGLLRRRRGAVTCSLRSSC